MGCEIDISGRRILDSIGFIGTKTVDYNHKIAVLDDDLCSSLSIKGSGSVPLSDLRDRFEPNDREWLREVMSRCYRDSDGLSLVLEYRIRGGDNRERWVHERCHILRTTTTGRVVRAASALFDITTFKRQGGRCLTNPRSASPDPAGDLSTGLSGALHAARRLQIPDLVDDIAPLARDAAILATSDAHRRPLR